MKNFILKCIIPAFLIILGLVLYTYFTTGKTAPFGSHHIILFIIATVAVTLFWGFLEYSQNVIGELMKGSWSQRIIFIIVAIVMIYLYKSTGRI